MTYDDLATIMEPIGYPLAMPGETDVALPCFFLDPQGIVLEEGFPVAYEVVAISSRVPLAENNPAQWDLARTMMYQLMNELRGTKVMFDIDIDAESTLETTPAQIAYTMTAQFPGEPICQPTVLLVEDAAAPAELITYLTA